MHVPLSNRVMIYSSPNAPLRCAEPRHVSSKHFKPVRRECGPSWYSSVHGWGSAGSPFDSGAVEGFRVTAPPPPDPGVAQAEEATSHEGWGVCGCCSEGCCPPMGARARRNWPAPPPAPSSAHPRCQGPRATREVHGSPPQCSGTQVTHPEGTEDS